MNREEALAQIAYLSPENAAVLLEGDSALADMMIEFMNSGDYQADRYLETEGRIIKE